MANPLDQLSATGMGDLNTTLKIANQNASQLIQTLQNVFPRVSGTFTLSGNANTTVTQPAMSANSIVNWTPTNASGAANEGSAKKLYLSAVNAGANFVVATGNGSATASTATFQYWVWTPV